jgi:hypothetical protein
MGRVTVLISLAGLMVASCGPDGADSWQSALDDVVATELAFARLATDSTVQHAFLANIAADGLLFRPGPIDGPAWLEANPMPPDLRLEWQPAWADVAADGSVGYTTGPWRSGRRGTEATGGGGQYVTLWRRSPDGYRAVLDFGTGALASPATPPLERAVAPAAEAPVDDTLAARQSVLIADEDLGVALTGSGSAAWASYAHPTARWLRDGAEPAVGADSAPDDAWGRTFQVLGSDAAGSGDLAWTWGAWQPAAEERSEPTGYYLRIWRRYSDGTWRVVLEAVARSG